MKSELHVQFLDWDSSFFERRVARLDGNRVTTEALEEVTAACMEQKIDCLYSLVGAEETGTTKLLEEQGFHLVDIRVTLDKQVGVSAGNVLNVSPVVRLANFTDIPALRLIAAVNHRDSRFYHDGGFSSERCDELYATWIEKSCNGYADAVLVADCGEGAVGYLSCHIRDNGVGNIGLVGVSSTCQGKGIGKQLLNESLRWFSAAGISRVEVVTQGRNVPAQRLYQKSGFLTSSLQLWYHRWFKPGKI